MVRPVAVPSSATARRPRAKAEQEGEVARGGVALCSAKASPRGRRAGARGRGRTRPAAAGREPPAGGARGCGRTRVGKIPAMTELPDALYEPDGARWQPTALTRGPWDRGFQHAGPPAALLARALEERSGIEGGQTVRLSYDILRPVPIAPLRIEARALRPGRRVELLEAALLDDADGTPLMRATAWRMRAEGAAAPRRRTRRAAAPASRGGPGAGLRVLAGAGRLPSRAGLALPARRLRRAGPRGDLRRRLRVPLVAAGRRARCSRCSSRPTPPAASRPSDRPPTCS